jgi:hypothetical protein
MCFIHLCIFTGCKTRHCEQDYVNNHIKIHLSFMHSVKNERIIEGRTCPVGHSAVCPSVILYVSSVKPLKYLMIFGIEVCSRSCQAN